MANDKDTRQQDYALGEPLYYRNNGLFSDNYLRYRLSDPKADKAIIDQWHSHGLPDFTKAYEWMSQTWDEMKDILPTLNEAQLEERWVRPVLKLLGWEYEVQDAVKKFGRRQIPDYSLFESKESWKRAKGSKTDAAYLANVLAVADAKAMDVELDGTSQSNSNPSYQIVRYLADTGKTWGILTDGRYWRLYSTRAPQRHQTYFEVNVEKLLVQFEPERFKYFFNFFRKDAFVRNAVSGQSFLDTIFDEGVLYAQEVETQLRVRAFRIVQQICRGFAEGKQNLPQEELDRIYQHSLFYLFRLMFVINCEAKGLLNIGRQSDYYPYSLRNLCVRLKEEFEHSRNWPNTKTSYNHVQTLLELIENGDPKIGIHQFGHEIFSSGDAKFFQNNPITDPLLNPVLVELACAYDDEGELKFIDYKRLSADHLGSIFEGLLEFRLKYATEKMGVLNGAADAWSELTEAKKKKPGLLVISKGELYLENTSSERKKTGAYYTPDYIVMAIVKHTLDPVVSDLQPAEILKLKILDPALGSGHFLLGVIKYLEDVILSKVLAKETPDIVPSTEVIRRQILENCLYGVDINPLAIELAKFSLWMFAASKNSPLPEIDGRLVCGDTLTTPIVEHFPKVKELGGFNPILGNPPYLHTRTGMIPEEKIAFYKTRFKSAEKQFDLFVLFIEKCVTDLLAKKGKFGFIVPKRLLSNENYLAARSMIHTNASVEAILDSGTPFEDASVETCLLFLSRSKGKATYQRGKITTESETLIDEVSMEEVQALPFSPLLINCSPQELALVSKLRKRCRSLGELCEITRGAECGMNDSAISDKKSDKPLLSGEHVEQYQIRKSGFYFHLKSEYSLSKYKPVSLYETVPKLLIRFVATDIVAALDEVGYWNTNSLYNVHVKKKEDLLPLLAILNSQLITFWFKKVFDNDEVLFPHIQKSQLVQIPILKDPDLTKIRTELATKAKRLCSDPSDARARQSIDELVFEAYGLTEKEKQLVLSYSATPAKKAA